MGNLNYYYRNKEKCSARSKLYRVTHKNQQNNNSRRWYLEHRTEILTKRKLARQNPQQRDLVNQKQREYRAIRNSTKPWMKYLRNAKARKRIRANRQCTLTPEQIKELWFRDKAHNLIVPSIDRIDSKGHYTFENCQFIELIDNFGRQWYPNYTLKLIPK